MIDRFEKFSLAISEIWRYWHKLATTVMKEHGLKGPLAVYFTTLYRFPNGITAAELSSLCSRDKADVSRMITLLEKRGLVQRIDNTNNSYKIPVVLTDEGVKIAEDINQKVMEAVEKGGEGLSESEREVFYNSLDLISENLQNLTEKGFNKG